MPQATVNGIDIYYRQSGDGFPIVLIHGNIGNSRNWALTVPALTPHYRTVSVDLRGHGLSGKPTRREDYTAELLAGDVHGVMRQLDIAECYLVGHSMGGMVAQQIALAHGDAVGALVLVDTDGGSPQHAGLSRSLAGTRSASPDRAGAGHGGGV